MEYFFVVAAALSFMGALTAVLQVRQIGWAVWIWFGSGWINGELALWLIGGQLSFVVLWIVSAGVTTPAFALGLSLMIAAWVLLALALRDGFDAGAAFSRALRSALGV